MKPPYKNRIGLPGIGSVKFHAQTIPAGKIKCGRICKRASGWHLCLFIDAPSQPIPHVANGRIGIDPGFKHLLTFSTGEKIEHPRELEVSAKRLAQAQRGINRKLVGRIYEKIARQRKDRNHKLSRRLVAENALICFSKDRHLNISKKFGKSVSSSSHGQLREMLAYKSRAGGREYIEVEPRNSTKTCSTCGATIGPSGWAGLRVRFWTCENCGCSHDRDVNAAINALKIGAGDGPREDACETLACVRPKLPETVKTGAHVILDSLGVMQ
jgi:putative transposase